MLPPGYHLHQILKQAVTDSHEAVEVLPPSFLSASDWGLFADREDRSILVRVLNPVQDPADLTFALRDAEKVAKTHPSLAMTYIFLPDHQENILESWMTSVDRQQNVPSSSIRFFSYGVQEREGTLRLAIHEKAILDPRQSERSIPQYQEPSEVRTRTDEVMPELTPLERRDIEAISLELRRILEGDPSL